MSRKRDIKASGRIPGQWVGVRHEVLDSPAWKAMSFGARSLYVCLLRPLAYKRFNNGKLYRSTRDAAEELGARQQTVCIWFKELEHYGFIVMTDPGTVGPKGRAPHWRITDMAWGTLDGKPVEATKDYLRWSGEPFKPRAKKTPLAKVVHLKP
jgi:hypothetical protein